MTMTNWRTRPGTRFVALTLAAAVGCGSASVNGTGDSASLAASGSGSQQAGSWPDLNPAELLERARQLVESSSNDSAEFGAIANRLEGDAARILTYVRDEFAFDPYRGSLRGASGTLHARAGNAIDRSLLLAALLEATGHTVRLVRGRLSAEAASKLVAHAASVPKTPAATPTNEAADEAAAKALSENAEVLKIGQALAKQFAETIDRRVQASLGVITKALTSAGLAVAASPIGADDVRDHVWVQVQVENDWKDLDSSFPDGVVGKPFAKPEGDPGDPHDVPQEWFQRLRLRISATYKGRQPEVILEGDWATPELVMKPLTLAFMPKDKPDSNEATVFQPAVSVDSKVVTGGSIDIGPKRSLERVQLDVVLSGPGMPEARSSRTIASASGANDLQPAEPLRQQLEKIYQFLAAPSPVPFEWAVRQQHAVLDYVTAPEGKEPPAISVDLVNLARAMVDGDQKTGRARAFRARPLVIAQRIGITGSGGTRKLVKSFDIIYNRMHFLGSDPMLAVRQGVFETELERAVFPGAEVFNTSTVFERSAGAVQVFRAGEQQKVAALNLGAGVTRLISDDLSAGYVVLVPSARVQIAGRAVTGWWRVRPDGGETLGRMESGEGQGMIEKVITTALTAIPSIYAFAAGKWCKSATGFCNPCLIAFAGFVGTVIGLHNFAVGGGVQLAWRGLNLNVPAGLVYGGVMGAGAYGMWQRTSKCGDFLLDWAMGG